MKPPQFSYLVSAASVLATTIGLAGCGSESTPEQVKAAPSPTGMGGSSTSKDEGDSSETPTDDAPASSQEDSKLCAADPDWTTCAGLDFTELPSFPTSDWTVSTWGNENRTHSPDNVWLEGGLLHLKVDGGTPKGETTTGAEIVSGRSDFFYGSYRIVAKTSDESGTVFGWFYYLNDKSEIDIEILSQFNDERLGHFTIHENIGSETHQAPDLGFRPSDDFHEYRFDWLEDRVDYFVDGEKLVSLTTNVPNEPGRILLNHWTLSNPAWGGGPPAGDAIAQVKRIEIYENR